MMPPRLPDIIPPTLANTLPGLFHERVRRSGDATAYVMHKAGCWWPVTWRETARQVAQWRKALARENLNPGDRVAILLPNRLEWVLFDQAALALGLVVVPLYLNDRPENMAHILTDAGAVLLLVPDDSILAHLAGVWDRLQDVQRILVLEGTLPSATDHRVVPVSHWLPPMPTMDDLPPVMARPDDLATIVYTSGTTGPPKGVMLSHRNLLANAHACLSRVPATPGDLFLSFLPLSHALERTAGLYLSMMAGSATAFARSLLALKDDLVNVAPTVLISVPRIYERVYQEVFHHLDNAPVWQQRMFQWTVRVGWQNFLYQQGQVPWDASLLSWPLLDRLVAAKVRARLGGRLRLAVSGGAPLAFKVARLFLALGVPILQGYGMTETGPVISVNTPEANHPASVGELLPATEARFDPQGELLVRGPQVMMGYWRQPEATRQVLEADGWLRTGDLARLEEGRLVITGRLKEIIVMANGRKVSPSDLETAITQDPLFPQAVVVGENQSFLSLLAVLNPHRWSRLARDHGLDPDNPASLNDPRLEQMLLDRIGQMLHAFPGFAQVRRLRLHLEPWTVENGMATPTLKPKRGAILRHHAEEIRQIYLGHAV